MNTTQTIKSFEQLTVQELYTILKLRNEVFIVEQNCVYPDLDGKDLESYHLLYRLGNELAAYARLLPAGVSYPEISIGRVLTAPSHRGHGLGKKLMEAAIAGCYELFGKAPIRIGAQYYLLKFYQSLGFVAQGEIYLEDGIEHIEMVKP